MLSLNSFCNEILAFQRGTRTDSPYQTTPKLNIYSNVNLNLSYSFYIRIENIFIFIHI